MFSFIFRVLRERLARVYAAHRNANVSHLLAVNNPTCRIMTTALNDVVLGKYVAILSGATVDKVDISDFSYISNDSVIINVKIGKFCSIGPRVQIGLAPHPSKVFVSTYPAFYSNNNTGCPLALREDKIFDDATPKTILANDIWIGANAIIPGGIRIGTGAIVATGAVVVKDVPPYAIVGGNPAEIIRYRFSGDLINILLESKWWDWPIEKIARQVDDFADIEKFQKSERG